MALSRPDITDSLRRRKALAIEEEVANSAQNNVLLTNCPSCIQGLGRSAGPTVTPRHIIVDLAMKTGGEKWQEKLNEMLTNVEVVRF